MIVSDIVTRVQRQFGDESGVQVTETDVIRWINDSQQEAVLQHTFLLYQTATSPTVAGQQQYATPSDCIDIKTVRYKEASSLSFLPLKYYNTKEMDEYIFNWQGTDFTGEPEIWTKGNNNQTIALFPVPDAVGTLQFEYGRYPTPVITAADALDLPPYYHQYITEFCLMKAFEMDEEWEAMDRKAAYVQSTLDANFARDEQFGKDVYPSVVPSSGDYV